MKKYICNPLWLVLLCVAFISSCDKEESVFDHELPQFELRSDAILLEVIMPQGTGASPTWRGKYCRWFRNLRVAWLLPWRRDKMCIRDRAICSVCIRS